MRIVAGELRGKTIDAPEGQGTRPTTDRVREALFSSLYSLRGGFEDAVVLDAFAGSGALGLEALSRGAEHCTFFERDAKAAAVLSRNIASCGLDSVRAQLVRRDVLQTVPSSTGVPFDLVFLDPPYSYDAVQVLEAVAGWRDCGKVAPEAIVVYEHDLKNRDVVEQAAVDAGFKVESRKKYGKTGITILEA